jgi:hypothetical protein
MSPQDDCQGALPIGVGAALFTPILFLVAGPTLSLIALLIVYITIFVALYVHDKKQGGNIEKLSPVQRCIFMLLWPIVSIFMLYCCCYHRFKGTKID